MYLAEKQKSNKNTDLKRLLFHDYIWLMIFLTDTFANVPQYWGIQWK